MRYGVKITPIRSSNGLTFHIEPDPVTRENIEAAKMVAKLIHKELGNNSMGYGDAVMAFDQGSVSVSAPNRAEIEVVGQYFDLVTARLKLLPIKAIADHKEKHGSCITAEENLYRTLAGQITINVQRPDAAHGRVETVQLHNIHTQSHSPPGPPMMPSSRTWVPFTLKAPEPGDDKAAEFYGALLFGYKVGEIEYKGILKTVVVSADKSSLKTTTTFTDEDALKAYILKVHKLIYEPQLNKPTINPPPIPKA